MVVKMIMIIGFPIWHIQIHAQIIFRYFGHLLRITLQFLNQSKFPTDELSGNLALESTLQMFAGIYRDLSGKSECRDFKFMGIACIPTIPVIFEVNQNKVWTFYIPIHFIKIFQISLYFLRGFQAYM